MKWILAFLLLCTPIICYGQATDATKASDVELRKLALTIAGEGTNQEKVQRLVTWVNTNLAWVATDYVQRTPEQILERRAGNCADLASVLRKLLDYVDIHPRTIREVNIQPENPGRQERAAAMVKEKGLQASVFGLHHNDHVWLEIYEPSTKEWFPADPTNGFVGIHDWEMVRVGLGKRPLPPVEAVRPIVKDQLVPFVVVVVNKDFQVTENRTEHYLIEGFNNAYSGKLSRLTSWPAWVSAIKKVSPEGEGAFRQQVNLHQHDSDVTAVWDAYQRLREEAVSAKIVAQSSMRTALNH
jgi:hypothetical protein